MTLALYGKSRRRQLILVLLAIVTVAAAALAGSGSLSGRPTGASSAPDLTVSKTNNVNGTIEPGESFTWTIEIKNEGSAPAAIPFFMGNGFFIDDLPAGASYALEGADDGAVKFLLTTDGGTHPEHHLECTLPNGNRVVCESLYTNADLLLNPGESITLQLNVTPAGDTGVLSNPRPGGSCRVDPGDRAGHIPESDETNNDCSDTVTVVDAPDPVAEPLDITASGSGSYVESYEWDVSKAVVGDSSRSALAGQSATFDFSLDVSRSLGYSEIAAGGSITIQNPGSNTEDAILDSVAASHAGSTITDCDYGGGTVGISDGDGWAFPGGHTLQPGDTVTCSWEYSAPDSGQSPSPFDNAATVAVAGGSEVPGGSSGTHTVTFAANQDSSTPGEFDLYDIFDGETPEEVQTGIDATTGSIEHSVELTCPDADDDAFYDGATGNVSGDNIARISGDSGFEVDSDPVSIDFDCTRPELTLEKAVVGGDASPGDWTLEVSGMEGMPDHDYTFSGRHGVSGYVQPGATLYPAEEDGPGGYEWTAFTCKDASGNELIALDDPQESNFTMPGEDITCTFTSEQEASTLTLRKIIVGAGDELDAGEFRLAAEQDGETLVSKTGTDTNTAQTGVDFETDTVEVEPGERIAIDEVLISGGGGSLDNYDTMIACEGGGSPIAVDPGDNPGFVPGSATDYVCTITNTRWPAQVQITKQALDVDGNPSILDPNLEFQFTSSEGDFTLGGGGITIKTFNNLPAGSTFEFEEDLETLGGEWELQSLSCTGADNTTDGAAASIDLPANGIVSCEVVNRQVAGALEVTKDVDWGDVSPDESETFEICLQGPSFPAPPGVSQDGACQEADHEGGTLTWDGLIPGDYTVTERGVDEDVWAVVVDDDPVSVKPDETASHTVTNTRLSGDISVTTTVDADGGDAGNWEFEACVYPEDDTDGDALDCVTLDADAPTAGFDGLDPGDYTIAESGDALAAYTSSVTVDGVTETGPTANVEVTTGQTVDVEFTNTLQSAEVVVEKRYGSDFDTATCDDPAEADGPAVTVGGDDVTGDGCTFGPVAVGANVDHTVDESPAEGWAFAGVDYSAACRVGSGGPVDVLELVTGPIPPSAGMSLASALTVNTAPGETCTVTYLNEPVGDVVLIKHDNVPSASEQTWTFESGDSLLGNTDLATAANDGGSTSEARNVADGLPVGEDHTISEVDGEGQCTVDSTGSDYQTHALAAYGEEPSLDDLAEASVIADGELSFDIRPGETTYIVFENRGCGHVLGTANLFVENFVSGDGGYDGSEPLPGWTIDITGTGGLADGFEASLPTDSEGMAGFGAVPAGTYTICQVAHPAYEVIGSTADDGQGEVPGDCRTGVDVIANGGDIDTTVEFYNQPRGEVRVEKTTTADGEPTDDHDGWVMTVTGCGYEATRQTGGDGLAVFDDVPVCDELTVREDADSKPGYVPVSGTSRVTSVEAGEAAIVNFTNEAEPDDSDPGETVVAESPTAAPTQPSESATETPTPAESEDTSTPADPTQISGGPSATATPTAAESEDTSTPADPTQTPGDPSATATPTSAEPEDTPTPEEVTTLPDDPTATATPTPADPAETPDDPSPTATPGTPGETTTPVDPTTSPTPVDDVAGEHTPGPGNTTETPTPVDDVAGEHTPGAAGTVTPVVPDSGTGRAPGDGAPLLAAVGMLVLLAGMSCLFAARLRQ